MSRNKVTDCPLLLYRLFVSIITCIVNLQIKYIVPVIYRLWCFTKQVLWIFVVVLDWLVSNALELALYQYWDIVGRFPKFLTEYEHTEEDKNRLENKIFRLKDKAKCNKQKANDEIKRLNDSLCVEKRERSTTEEKNNSLKIHITELINERDALEKEKKRALKRLSEQVSVKLRDNNPNIADLNDEHRPTKLAEMFSEMYDNEWTNAFALLENKFGEQDTIKVLLGIVMEAYAFCEAKVAEPWAILNEWFLDMNILGAQNAVKWLKDSRKIVARKKALDVQKEYECKLLSTCKNGELKELMQREPLKVFTTKCIELCLLMVTSDPPVVMECPLYEPFLKNSSSSSIREYANGSEEYNANMNLTRENDLKNVQKNSEDSLKNPTSIRKGELIFDKDLFKEYTRSGKYLDFVVWPTLFLHKGGHLLSKGIAQGNKKRA